MESDYSVPSCGGVFPDGIVYYLWYEERTLRWSIYTYEQKGVKYLGIYCGMDNRRCESCMQKKGYVW